MVKFKNTDIGKIPSTWSIIPLTSVIIKYIDNRGKTVPVIDEPTKMVLIATNCIKEDALYPVRENVRYVSDQVYKTWFRAHPQTGDIIVVNKGTPGLVCSVPDKIDFCIAQDMIALRIDNNKLYNKFLFAYMRSRYFKWQVYSLNVGTTIPHLKKTNFSELLIPKPSLSEQIIIGDVYFYLSQKVELLSRQNQTLENIAQILFKRWFIDFEFPDKNGKPYKSSGGKMVKSELGEIPEGWRIGVFEEIMVFTNGYAFKSKEVLSIANKNSYAIFKMGDIKKGGGFNASKTKSYIEKEKCEDILKYVLKKGDILMCMTDMKDKTSLLGHTALMFEDNHFIVNQRVGLIRAKNNINIDYPWIYILTNSINFIADLRNRANSGVQINLSTNEIKNSRVIIPDKRINKLFDDLTKPMFEKIMNNTFQVKALTKTRDTLLPKLMSGQMRVKDL